MKKIDRDKLMKTYGKFKFRISTKEEQISAMGLTGESTLFKKMISMDYENYYENIKAPDIGDWLMEHKEYGQTYHEYMNGGIVPVIGYKDTIYMASLACGEKGNLDENFVNSLIIFCEAYFYGMKVKLLENPIDLMKYQIDIRQYKDNKFQINANQILVNLSKELPQDAFCLIAFTDKDLYNDEEVTKMKNKDKTSTENFTVNPQTNFCYGLSSLKNKINLISFARYDPFFYSNFNMENSKSQEKLMKCYFILLKRACKVIVKEICHMFGIKNCIFFSCNMNGFNSMEEFDMRPLEICPVCLRKLYSNISMKSQESLKSRLNNPLIIYDRFVKLQDILLENFYGMFEYETEWFEKRIDCLKSEI